MILCIKLPAEKTQEGTIIPAADPELLSLFCAGVYLYNKYNTSCVAIITCDTQEQLDNATNAAEDRSFQILSADDADIEKDFPGFIASQNLFVPGGSK